MVLYDIVTDVHPNIRRRTSGEDLIAGDAVYISGEEIVSQTNNASCDGKAFAGIAMDSVARGKVLSIATAPTEVYANATGTITVGKYIVPGAAGYVANATEGLIDPIIIGYALKAAADSKVLMKLTDVPVQFAQSFAIAKATQPINSNGNSFSTIQAAIDDIPSEGGWIYVPPGIWTSLDAVIINKNNVHLFGAGFSSHIKVSAADEALYVTGPGDYATIEKLTLENILETEGFSGVLLSGDDCIFQHCQVITNDDDTDGIKIHAPRAKIFNNLIKTTGTGYNSGGIHISNYYASVLGNYSILGPVNIYGANRKAIVIGNFLKDGVTGTITSCEVAHNITL